MIVPFEPTPADSGSFRGHRQAGPPVRREMTPASARPAARVPPAGPKGDGSDMVGLEGTSIVSDMDVPVQRGQIRPQEPEREMR